MNYSKKAFEMAIIASVLMALGIISIILVGATSMALSQFIGLFLVVGGIFGIAGSYFSIRGFKEPTTKRKIAATTVNFGITLILIALILANLVDVVKDYN